MYSLSYKRRLLCSKGTCEGYRIIRLVMQMTKQRAVRSPKQEGQKKAASSAVRPHLRRRRRIRDPSVCSLPPKKNMRDDESGRRESRSRDLIVSDEAECVHLLNPNVVQSFEFQDAEMALRPCIDIAASSYTMPCHAMLMILLKIRRGIFS